MAIEPLDHCDRKSSGTFAQTYSAKQLIKYGFISVGCSVVGLFISVRENLAVGVGVFITILFAVIPIIMTEKAIKARFKN